MGKIAHWVAGSIIALIGVGVVRLPGGEFAAHNKLLLLMAGTVLIFSGIYVFTRGGGNPPP